MTTPPIDQQNPYASNKLGPSSQNRVGKSGGLKGLLFGSMCSVLSAFPIAGFVALVYRFPVPLLGYLSGREAVLPAMIGVLVYGVLLGGFVLLGGMGALIAFAVQKCPISNPKHRSWIVAIAAVVGTLGCMMLLSTLDKIIGPW